MTANNPPLTEQYRSLRLYSWLAFGMGWLVITLGIVAAAVGIVMAIQRNDFLGLARPELIALAVGVVLGSSAAGVRLLAYSDLIFVHIHIEENTRASARFLAEMLDRQHEIADE